MRSAVTKASTTATKPKSKRRGTLLLERVNAAGRIDRAAGIVRGVKILGLHSGNGRDYSPAALRAAVPLYENAPVYLEHAPNVSSRKLADAFGRLRNVRLEKDGLRGDLHFLTKHPRAEQILEAAERMPESLGLSHHASGKVETRNGRPTVVEIFSVRSVDLVCNPATATSLFESQAAGCDKLAAALAVAARARKPLKDRLRAIEAIVRANDAAQSFDVYERPDPLAGDDDSTSFDGRATVADPGHVSASERLAESLRPKPGSGVPLVERLDGKRRKGGPAALVAALKR